MLKIICTGDSHTWGQGASDVQEKFDTPWVAGELRPVDFNTGSYVNVLRRMVESATDSHSRQWHARELAQLAGCSYTAPCAELNGDFQITFRGALLRLFLGPQQETVHWILSLDGKDQELVCNPAKTSNDFRILNFHLPEGDHILMLKKQFGTLQLHRLESYAGFAAVINCGIGSCPTFRFREQFWNDYAVALKPDIVLAEAHTINDWLSGDSPETYRKNLTNLLTDFRTLGAEPILMTVAPIGGAQRLPQTADDYEAYLTASRFAAKDCGAILCDANAVMKQMIAGMTTEEAFQHLLDDNWHPNDRGHAIYAALLAQALGQLIQIPIF